MGFLNFLHKKREETAELPAMPLPPPKIGSGEPEPLAMPSGEDEIGLPDFPERKESEELKLPDIGELEPFEFSEAPEFPETSEQGLHELPAADTEVIKAAEMPELEFPAPEEPKPVEEEASEVYKHTPAKPVGSLFRIEKETGHVPQIRGDVFIRAEDYRDLIEGLNRMITGQKEKFAKEEKDTFRLEEREHEKFVAEVEDIQRSLIVTENTLFE